MGYKGGKPTLPGKGQYEKDGIDFGVRGGEFARRFRSGSRAKQSSPSEPGPAGRQSRRPGTERQHRHCKSEEKTTGRKEEPRQQQELTRFQYSESRPERSTSTALNHGWPGGSHSCPALSLVYFTCARADEKTSTTECNWFPVISGKIGNASTSRAASSDTGKSPALYPKSA